jgi:hypothetical protein
MHSSWIEPPVYFTTAQTDELAVSLKAQHKPFLEYSTWARPQSGSCATATPRSSSIPGGRQGLEVTGHITVGSWPKGQPRRHFLMPA